MSSFPNPEGKINVLKRFLHILALLQHIPANDEKWNARSLAEIIQLEEGNEKPFDDSLIRTYIREHIVKELDITLDKTQGGWFTTIAQDLDKKTQLEIARVYADFVIKDTSRDVILERFIKAMPKTALWTLGRIYFASIEKRMIQINYTTNTGYKIRYWKLCPYYFVFRNNNLYLVAWDPKQKKRLPLLAERIKNLIVLEKEQSIPWDIPPVQEVFKDALSAFISDSKPVEMRVRYKKRAANIIESIISPLAPEIISVESGDWFESTFHITDYIYLCKQFVLYGSDVEIVSPAHVRKDMINMLKESLSVYEKK